MGQGALLEAEGDSLALHVLLPHASHHLGDIDEGALGPTGHHLDDVVLHKAKSTNRVDEGALHPASHDDDDGDDGDGDDGNDDDDA